MTDVEKRLTDSLRGVAEDAPNAVGLAEAARGRATRRRRRTTLAVAAASVAVLGVVAGTAMLGNGGGAAPPAADDPTPSVVVDPGPPQRVESWRDLQVTVPEDWGYGVLSTWCINGATSPGTPVVERPEGMREMILCTEPANGYGVQFQDGAALDFVYKPGEVWQYEAGDYAVYPVGAWLGYQRTGDNVVLVVTPDRATTEQVLSSFEHVTDVDANGCAPGQLDEIDAAVPGQVRLCRYLDGLLEQSEVLTGQDASDTVAALRAAPTRDAGSCKITKHRTMVEVVADGLVSFVDLGPCAGFGIGDEWHVLTGDVLHWVLSPGWSGQIPDGITFEPRR